MFGKDKIFWDLGI